MAAPAATALSGPSLTFRGHAYPILLPKLRDPRLHLAAVIFSLQILGQVAFDFRVSIAQILISLATCAVLEVGIAAWRQHVLLWPASALITGNGVSFILRVPGTEHGDWWSMHGWWIFVGTSAVSLLSKHVIQIKGATSSTLRTSGSCSASFCSAPHARSRSTSGGARCRRGSCSRSRSSSAARFSSSRA